MAMRIVHDLEKVQPASRSYVTIGIFDGVHRGHRQLIAAMANAAHSTRDIAVAITFDPHPATVLGYDPPLMLTSLQERIDLLASLDLDALVLLPFTQEILCTSATDFIDSLIHHLHLAELWGGPDFSLGYRREGDIPFLRRLGAERGFEVHIVEPLIWENAPVNSSRVRAALQEGDIAQAVGCLGRPYRLTGTVVHGRGVGHSIGVPTANIVTPPNRLIPTGGVYACQARTERLGAYPAVTNVGTRPTFAGQKLVVEAHLLDFDADLYDQALRLDFVARLRDELAFPTLNTLVGQIQEDIAHAREIFSVHGQPLDLERKSLHCQQHS